jgi:hypothetical protein
MITRDDWAKALLQEAGWPVTWRNRVTLVCWTSAEGTDARFNPLATTKPWPGATDFNSVHVKNYASLADGLHATLDTLDDTGHGYGSIRRGLRINRLPEKTLLAVKESDWGTGDLALAILPDVKNDFRLYAQKPIGQ